MTQAAVVEGTQVFKSVDKKDGRIFFWFRTPDGNTGGVVDINGRIPNKDEAVVIVPDKGKPFIGFKAQPAVLTY